MSDRAPIHANGDLNDIHTPVYSPIMSVLLVPSALAMASGVTMLISARVT
jgi:hypothetical protein